MHAIFNANRGGQTTFGNIEYKVPINEIFKVSRNWDIGYIGATDTSANSMKIMIFNFEHRDLCLPSFNPFLEASEMFVLIKFV